MRRSDRSPDFTLVAVTGTPAFIFYLTSGTKKDISYFTLNDMWLPANIRVFCNSGRFVINGPVQRVTTGTSQPGDKPLIEFCQHVIT